MKIPKSFKLFGETIQVISNDDWKFGDDDARLGTCNLRDNIITIRTKVEEVIIAEDRRESTFTHELMHMIYYFARHARDHKAEMHRDEGFIEVSAGLLHQALTTMEYDDVQKQSFR